MSMFHELMMRKKQETLYPVIKGSLTDTDGVISGFVNTGGNYLQINNMNSLSSADSWEIVIKISGEKSREYILGTNLERIIAVSVATGKLYLSSDGSTWDIASGVGSGSVPANSYIRVKFTGTQYTFDHSSDNVTWVNLATVTSSTKISSLLTYLKIGAWNSFQTSNFVGSIDLNNSYIKLGSTKYKLQAVVGYTIVGSPTIVDGVVSGFSANDYLQINNANVFAQADSWEIMIKKSGVVTGYLFGTNKHYAITFTQMSIYLSSNSSSWDIASGVGTGQSSEDCFLRIRFTGTQYIYDYSIDTVNWTTLATVNSISKITNLVTSLQIGHWVTSYYATGSIDLNNTYIKINNKLWFNGQQA